MGAQCCGTLPEQEPYILPHALIEHATPPRARSYASGLCSETASLRTCRTFDTVSDRAGVRLSFSRPGSRPPSRAASSCGTPARIGQCLRRLPPDVASDTFPTHCVCEPRPGWEVLNPTGINYLRTGGATLTFACATGDCLSEATAELVASISGMCSEGSALFDLSNRAAASGRMFIVSKTVFAVPHLDVAALSPQLLASVEYQRAVCDGSMKVRASPSGRDDSFALTKVFVRGVFSVQMHYRIVELKGRALLRAARLADRVRLDRAFMLIETTSRQGQASRSLLLYHSLAGGGAVYWNIVCMVRASLPGPVVKMIDTFGTAAAGDIATSTNLTRAYWAKRARQR
eukprot:TRINITY_DN11660_c0_g1_i1.p1 TRINITY_DN11660_c0_g1~~TRINITY_DN11660_c0_g1_i1.p1  ORF type:complete len:369 (+),score=107.02 TRINITY_DN11660_c0_g1_i1:74-1108(+)